MGIRQRTRAFARAIRKGLEGKEAEILRMCADMRQPCPIPDWCKIVQLERTLPRITDAQKRIATEMAIGRLQTREHGAFEICLHKFVVHMGHRMGFSHREIWASKLWLNTRGYEDEVNNVKGLPEVKDRPK